MENLTWPVRCWVRFEGLLMNAGWGRLSEHAEQSQAWHPTWPKLMESFFAFFDELFASYANKLLAPLHDSERQLFVGLTGMRVLF